MAILSACLLVNWWHIYIYMQTDAYQATGCYNLLCSGFVQTNNRIAMGAAITPTSSYRGAQFDISLLIWKVYMEELINVPQPLHCRMHVTVTVTVSVAVLHRSIFN